MQKWLRFPSMSAFLAITLLMPAATFSAQVELGDTLKDVKKKMGRPQGTLRQGEQVLLQYDRGIIEVYEGYVVQTDLITAEAAKAKKARERQAAAAQRKAAKARSDQLLAAGKVELAKTLEDESFAEKSGEEQVAHWNQFKRTYPDIDVSEQLAAARKKQRSDDLARREAELKAEKERLASLAPQKRLSSRKLRRERRRLVPGQPVVTAPYTPEYRQLGGDIAQWPYR